MTPGQPDPAPGPRPLPAAGRNTGRLFPRTGRGASRCPRSTELQGSLCGRAVSTDSPRPGEHRAPTSVCPTAQAKTPSLKRTQAGRERAGPGEGRQGTLSDDGNRGRTQSSPGVLRLRGREAELQELQAGCGGPRSPESCPAHMSQWDPRPLHSAPGGSGDPESSLRAGTVSAWRKSPLPALLGPTHAPPTGRLVSSPTCLQTHVALQVLPCLRLPLVARGPQPQNLHNVP